MTPKDLDRQAKLNALQERHGVLTAKKKALTKEIQENFDKVGVINRELKSVGNAIFDLKNVDSDTPHITDHAVVRYLERVKGMDIWAIKAEIMQYKKSLRIDNTIVTVNKEENAVS